MSYICSIIYMRYISDIMSIIYICDIRYISYITYITDIMYIRPQSFTSFA